MLGRWVIRPINPASQRIILKIVGFDLETTNSWVLSFMNSKLVDIVYKHKDKVKDAMYFKKEFTPLCL